MNVYNFSSAINSYLSEPYSTLTNGIIFGLPIRGNGQLYEELKRVGLLHIAVLSGMNISILASIVLQTTSVFKKSVSLLLTMAIIILFTLFVGVEPPILRASITSIIILFGVLLGKKTISLYILLLTAFIMLVIFPQWLSSISFQLSYAATLGLIIFRKKSNRSNVKNNNNVFVQIRHYCIDEFYTCLSAQVFTVPLLFLYFKQISVIAPVSNILISWTIPPLMVFGFLTSGLLTAPPISTYKGS